MLKYYKNNYIYVTYKSFIFVYLRILKLYISENKL